MTSKIAFAKLKEILKNNSEGIKCLECLIDMFETEGALLNEAINEVKDVSEDYNKLYLKHLELLKEYQNLETNFIELDKRVSNISGEYNETRKYDIQ